MNLVADGSVYFLYGTLKPDQVAYYLIKEFVDADKTGASTKLTLPGLVDMQDGGDTGVLANGWMFRLATPTIRNCSVTTSHLRDFINRYAGKRSVSTFNFKTDEIESVTCVTS